MFKSWSKKHKIKAVFQLQFLVTQVPKLKKSALMISLVPDDVGKPTVKLEKAAVQDGTCLWENPVFEAVKLVKDGKSGKLGEKIYHFVVSTGSSKSGFLGEASIDLADFASETEPVTVSLPLKFANSGAILHVTILNIEGPIDQREGEDGALGISEAGILKSQLSNGDEDSLYYFAEDGDLDNRLAEANMTESHVHHRSNADRSMGSASDLSSGDWTNSPEDGLPREMVKAPSDNSVEKLKSEIDYLMRQAEVSELELQSLRKQITKESTRVQNLSTQVMSLTDERDALRIECEQLKSRHKTKDNEVARKLRFEIEDARVQLQAMKEEITQEKDLKNNLQVQLQKTQSSNSELVVAVRDLEALLEQKNSEIQDLYGNIEELKMEEEFRQKDSNINLRQDGNFLSLEKSVPEQDDNKQASLFKLKLEELNGEIDVYRKQNKELDKQIRQLSLENKHLIHENQDLYLTLEQIKKEHSMTQKALAASLATIQELELQDDKLQETIKKQADEVSEYMVSINELETKVKSLEKRLERQAVSYEDNLNAVKCEKIEQEERAVNAEETLRQTKQSHSITVEHFQEENRRLYDEMATKVEEQEKMIMRALNEAEELQEQKRSLEELLEKSNQEIRRIQDQHELKLQEEYNQLDMKGKLVEKMTMELENKSKKLENAEKLWEENHEAYSTEIQRLRSEIEKLLTEKSRHEALGRQYGELMQNVHEDELEKENMKQQVLQMKGELNKREEIVTGLEKELNNCKERSSTDNNCGTFPCDPKNCTNLMENLDMSKGKCNNADLLIEVEKLRQRNNNMERELKEMEDRYSEISLKFAEVEGERQELVMKLRNLKNGRKH